MRRTAIAAIALAASTVVIACGDGSESANLEIVARFPEISDVDTASIESLGYCRSDSCTFGDDGVNTLVIFDVTSPLDDDGIVDAYVDVFEGWQVERDRICLSETEGRCQHEVLFARLRDGSAQITFNFDNWPTRFEVAVDANAG